MQPCLQSVSRWRKEDPGSEEPATARPDQRPKGVLGKGGRSASALLFVAAMWC